MNTIAEKCQGPVQCVKAIVREKTGCELTDQEIIDLHLLALEPAVLARSIVFKLTGKDSELAEDGDDECEVHTPHQSP
ncbi:MAG: hypothetical protein HUU20_28130 [Pirellulales bacterium]|nr:hypothetical protein [Pirellulales bacterium]